MVRGWLTDGGSLRLGGACLRAREKLWEMEENLCGAKSRRREKRSSEEFV